MCMCFFAHKNIIFDKIAAILTLTFQTLVYSIDWMCWGSWVRMGQGVRTGLGHGGITCVLQTQFSSYQLFFWIYTPSRHKIQVLKGLAEEVFSISDIIFRHYVKMPPIKYWIRLTTFMISISLFEKFCCQNFITSIEVIKITGYSSKSNKLMIYWRVRQPSCGPNVSNHCRS